MLMPSSASTLEHPRGDAGVVLHAEPDDRDLGDLLVALDALRADRRGATCSAISSARV